MASIEDEIKTEGFTSPYQKLVVNMMYTTSWLNSLQNELFKSHKLSPPQYNVLRILRGQHPKVASVNLLKERMIDKMSNVSRILDKLVEKKLVTRKVCATDRRQVDIKITAHGLSVLGEIDARFIDWEQKLHGISEEEAKNLSEMLDKWRN